MSDQTPTTSTINQNKTKVFILSPDILKKLGIASKIPNFTSNKLPANVATETSKQDETTKETETKIIETSKNQDPIHPEIINKINGEEVPILKEQTIITKDDIIIENVNNCSKEEENAIKSNFSGSKTANNSKTDPNGNESIKLNESDTLNTDMSVKKRRGRKRKIIESSPDLNTPVRKSGRMRKPSTLHSDFVTELKLHDGCNSKTNGKSPLWTYSDKLKQSEINENISNNQAAKVEDPEVQVEKEIDEIVTSDFRNKRGRPPKIKKENPCSSVTCAVCNEKVTKGQWKYHIIKHNFLCWKVGETPIDLQNRKEVEYVLYKAVKNQKSFKCFTCPHCDDKKKSVVGFLCHLDMCQLTEEERYEKMILCTICTKKVLPQSFSYHMKAHEKHIAAQRSILEESPADLNSSRSKRKAASKAANLIQEVANQENFVTKKVKTEKKLYKKAGESCSVFRTFGIINKLQMEFRNGNNKCRFNNCTYKTNEFDELKKHLNCCPALNDDDYICKFCLHVEKDVNLMKEHITNNHIPKKGDDYKNSDESSLAESEDLTDEEIDDQNAKKLSKPASFFTKPTYRIGFLSKERRIINNPLCTYLPAVRWTQEFRRSTYSENLFDNIKCLTSNIQLLTSEETEEYVPLLKQSMSVRNYQICNKIPNLQQKQHEWKEYDLYETNLENDTATIFCGGPIWSIAWIPTPTNLISDQYLAVSLQKDFEATYKMNEAPSGREVIQFWNFGRLDSKKQIKNPPVLEFSLAHNHGMVWCMEWCPSGYYDTNDIDGEQLKKLGLLALACSDGTVPIYPIGIPAKNIEINNIYKMKPAYKLILQDSEENLLGQWKYQVTKISWSKGSGHNKIAGGFTNGMICLWDLTTSSPLLKSEENGVIILKPYCSFQAHSSAISALVLYPLIDEGQRWLLTGSWDRTFKYWDLNNTSVPVSVFGKRGVITDGVWLQHWLCSFIGYDDVFSPGHTVTSVQNVREFGYKQTSALATNSVVLSLSASDWASAVAQANSAGELIATFPRTILISFDVDKNLQSKRLLLSYNELIDKTKNISERKNVMNSEKILNEKEDTIFSNTNREIYVEEPTTYKQAREKYGILFCDLNLDNFRAYPQESLKAVRQSCRLREVPTELYPFSSLNRIAWNPNKQAYLFIACGYQNGFVRLRCVRFMNLKSK